MPKTVSILGRFLFVFLLVINGDPAFRSVEAGEQEEEGLNFRLSEGAQRSVSEASESAAPSEAEASTLSRQETEALLRSLAPIPSIVGDDRKARFLTKSTPPPKADILRKSELGVPSAVADALPERARAKVVRFRPQGDVEAAHNLSVTFSRPIVPLGTRGPLAPSEVPVVIDPQPAGTWRWIGTDTLLFEPRDRFPMATHYSVSIPPGASFGGDKKIGEGKSWSFATAALRLHESYPQEGPQQRDAVLGLVFNQRIDPAAVLEHVEVRSNRSDRPHPVRLATADEIEGSERVLKLRKRAADRTWLALVPTEPLPRDAEVEVTIRRGAPSAEGPLCTSEDQSFQFRTVAPLRVVKSSCGGRRGCEPRSRWSIEFNNPLDDAGDLKSMIRVEPAIGAFSYHVNDEFLIIWPDSSARTTYRVTLSPEIRDRFGQTMGRDAPLSFEVGLASPWLYVEKAPFAVLDPTGPPRLTVESVNYQALRVRLYQTAPEHWPAFARFLIARDKYDEDDPDQTPPKWQPTGKLLETRVVRVQGRRDETARSEVDLAAFLSEGVGQFVVIVEAVEPADGDEEPTYVWVQATNLGLDVLTDETNLYAWATSLADGAALADVEVRLEPGGGSAKTDVRGLAILPLPHFEEEEEEKDMPMLVARSGADRAFLPDDPEPDAYSGYFGWNREDAFDSHLEWFTFDDREIYRPGETVHVKGWVRHRADGQLRLPSELVEAIAYELKSPDGEKVAEGEAKLSELGGFDLALELPDDLELGEAELELSVVGLPDSVGGWWHQNRIDVREFRRPEFAVAVTGSPGPHVIGSQAELTASAAYYSGGPLSDAEVDWLVTASEAEFSLPNWTAYSFGPETFWRQRSFYSRRTETYDGMTDSAGEHRLRLHLDAINPPRPMKVVATASVQDFNEQAWSGETSLLVHPAAFYVGLRAPNRFVPEGVPLRLETVVIDPEGKAVAGREIRLHLLRVDWVYENNQWRLKTEQRWVGTAASVHGAVEVTTPGFESGRYRAVATVQDDQGRRHQSELSVWVEGASERQDIEPGKVDVIAQRDAYQPGETAELLVHSPFYPAEGLLIVNQSLVLRVQRFQVTGATTTLRVPITERCLPEVSVDVYLAGSKPRSVASGWARDGLPREPAHGYGSATLSVPATGRTLSIDLAPRQKILEPGGETTVDVRVRDAAGAPVEGAEVALYVVDQAVLDLIEYETPDPISVTTSLSSTAYRPASKRSIQA